MNAPVPDPPPAPAPTAPGALPSLVNIAKRAREREWPSSYARVFGSNKRNDARCKTIGAEKATGLTDDDVRANIERLKTAKDDAPDKNLGGYTNQDVFDAYELLCIIASLGTSDFDDMERKDLYGQLSRMWRKDARLLKDQLRCYGLITADGKVPVGRAQLLARSG